jgi:tetratricopeptide (TPR) repeat protein
MARLAYHFRRAGVVDARAVDYVAAAGQQALGQLAFDQAVTFFAQALEAADDVESGPERRCALLVSLGTSQRLAAVAAFRETLLRAARLAQELGDAEELAAGQLFYARAAQGRLNELVDLVRQQAADNPGIAAWQAALALTLTRLGHHNEVIDLVNELMVDPTTVFPRDGLWLTGRALLAEAVAVVGNAEQADREYEILAPYAGRLPSNGTVCMWSVSLGLATLAAPAGRPEDAERHFVEAHEQHERIGAPVWLARTQLEWGRFLLGAGESPRALTLLEQAREGAELIRAADVVSDVDSLMANLK